MNKKELKKYINENGFFLQLDTLEKQDNSASGEEKENIIHFKGLASQKFGKGEVSRNGYKIDPKGWDTKNYMKNAQILLSHDDGEPIGRATKITPSANGLEIEFYINLNWVRDDADKARITDGAFSALSTGHITKEYKFENKETGEVLSPEEAEEKYDTDKWDLFYGDAWNFVVTKAELLEVSLVSLPSNPEALTLQNSLQSFKNHIMKPEKPEATPNGREEITPSKPEHNSGAETPPKTPSENEETKTEDNSVPNEETPETVEKNNNHIKTLENSVSDMTKRLDSQESIIKELSALCLNQAEKMDEMQTAVNSIPTPKGMMTKTVKSKESNALKSFLESKNLV